MPITIGSNISSLKAQRQLDRASSALVSTYEKLSSGQRINKASDDAAGLAVSSSLTSKARVYTQAARNVNDVVSLLNVADGALGELSAVVTRQRELAEQASNGVYSAKQRKALERETNSLVKEYNRIIDSTSFNGVRVFSADTSNLYAQHGYGVEQATKISIGEKLGPAAGDGTYGQLAGIGPANNAFFASTGDVNNDSLSDIVWGIFGGGSLGVQLGSTSRTFSITASAGPPTTVTPALADFNGDGNLDVALQSNAANEITVSLGNGDGTFLSSVTYSAVGNTNDGSISTGDVNGDGFIDIVTGDGATGSLLLGRGNGTFAATQTLTQGGTLLDLNNDGSLDLVDTTGAGVLRVALGRGNGTFDSSQTSSVANGSLGFPAGPPADFNGDGNIDLVLTKLGAEVLLGNGDGTFRSSYSYNNGNDFHNVAVGDINGDGITDFVAGDYSGSSGYHAFIGRGDGTFTVSNTQLPNGSQSIGLDDFDGDGIPDIVLGRNAGAGAVQVAFGNADSSGRRNPYQYSYDFSTQAKARKGLDTTQRYLERVSQERGNIGSIQSRLSTVLNNLRSATTETVAAAARITDTDVAAEAAILARTQILQQAGAAVLAQANLQPQLALQLLRN